MDWCLNKKWQKSTKKVKKFCFVSLLMKKLQNFLPVDVCRALCYKKHKRKWKKLLTKVKKLRIIDMLHSNIPPREVHAIKYRTNGYNQGRIISLIVFTKKPLVLCVNECSNLRERYIFYGAVLARGGIFFIELNIWRARSRWKHFVFGRLFLLFKEGYESV